MDMSELKNVLQEQGNAFHEFKKANDEKLAQIEKNGAALPETLAKVEAVEKQMSDLDQLRERLEKAEVKLDSPQLSKGDMDRGEAEQLAAFRKMVRSVKEGDKDFDRQAVAEYREKSMAVSIGTPTAGGHGVPEVISRQIDEKLLDISEFLPVVNVQNVGTSDFKKLVDTRGTSGGWVGETDTRSETNTSTLEQVAPTFGIVYAYPKATEESLQDIFFDVESWIINSAAEEFDKLIGEAIVSGNGTNKPTGFLNGTPSAVNDDGASPERPFGTIQYVPTGSAGAFPPAFDASASPQTGAQGDFLVDLIHKLKKGYRRNARFAMNKATLGEVRKFRDADGNYIWQPGLQMGMPSMLMGYPILEAEAMPDIGANTFPIAFGDFNAAYIYANRVGTSITVDDNITTPGYVKFYVRRRVGGILCNDDALKVVKCAAS
jgi:HK97 family phage major capsid protein